MLWNWYPLLSYLIIIWFYPSKAMCPFHCVCKMDVSARRKVSCLRGGMIDPIPTSNMDADMQMLEISAPDDNWNKLTIGPIFQSFKGLEEVHLTRSNIIQLGMHSFWGVPTLKVLNFTDNNISVVHDHNFRGLANLLELNLDCNVIQRISSGTFKHLPELRTLSVERNALEELEPRAFLKLGKLQVLKLSFNSQLLELNPEVFKDVPGLRVLECRGCGLRRINTQIYHLLPYLSHLDLGKNQMQFLAADEFHDLRKLRSLHLDGNQFPVVLEKTFINQGLLQILCVARNRLAKITNTAFLNLSGLIDLDISYNKLDRLEGVVFHPLAESLQKLSLSGNHFSKPTVKLVLQNAPKIQELSVADMGFGDISPNFFPDRLKFLNLSGNNLTEITAQAFPQQLIDLDLSRNKFRGLNEHVVLRLEQLRRVHLDDNPWACDLCHVPPILFRVNKTTSLQDLACASPGFLKDRAMRTLRFEDLATCDEGAGDLEAIDALTVGESKLSLVVGGICLLLFLVVCIIFVVCSCTKRRRVNNVPRDDKPVDEREAVFENPAAIFGDKGEISFKFPLDLTERKVSVSTIDEITKETQLHTLPNGTGI